MAPLHDQDLDMPVAQAVRLYLLNRLTEFETTAACLESPDPAAVVDAVHDLRVICRQILSCLHAFSPYLRIRRFRKIERGIRQINGILGPIRDLDILLTHDEVSGTLRATVEQKRADALSALIREYPGSQLYDRLDSMSRPLKQADADTRLSLPAITASGRVQSRTLGHVIPEILYRLAAEVTAYQTVVQSSDQDQLRAEILHRLRISCKQFRYTVAMMRPVLGRQADGLIQTFKDLQDVLGRLHDQQMLMQAISAQKKTAVAENSASAVWASIQNKNQLLLSDLFTKWPHCNIPWLHHQIRQLLDYIYPVDEQKV